MPQLAPLNWIFLMLFFWFMVMSMTIMFWWMKDKKFKISTDSKKVFSSKQWTW
uniref:ATP synthase F0 subunit 8 n=1 Tax=Sypharochiton pelliserpentis TaxID=256427 RepID=A0A059UAK5_9MOLL|nr:ATP synthase F0 subunit 8 [Sypharochiton pelliserpentis]AHZ60690.1 ATP synthase F0 subunit 8 [Sypharochiton pelliserpentis]